MIHLINPDLNVDWLSKSKPFVWLSTLMLVASVILLWKPGLNYGIDFRGGAVIELKAPQGWDTAKLRKELEDGGVKDPAVVQIGSPASNEYLIKVQTEEGRGSQDEQSTAEREKALAQLSTNVTQVITQGGGSADDIRKVDVVGAAAGANLRNTAFLSILYALICIVIYISFRFDTRYAPGVLRALAFDVITTLGIWVILGREFNLTVLAAILTIAGYSCNDTIVIYDRIRDYAKTHPGWKLEDCVNRSINLNLGRTILTTGCTLFVVLSLFFLGGPVLQDFSLPLLIGFTVSVPSTIFVANPLIVYMEKRRLAKQAALRGATGASKAKTNSSAPHPA